MKRIIIHSLLALSFAMNVSFIAYLWYQKQNPPQSSLRTKSFQRWKSCCILSSLDLDKKQKKLLYQLRKKMMGRRFAYRVQNKVFTKRIAIALSAAKTNQAYIAKQIKKYARHRELFQRWVAEHFIAIRSLLTPSQEKRFRKILRLHLLQLPYKGSRSCSVNIR